MLIIKQNHHANAQRLRRCKQNAVSGIRNTSGSSLLGVSSKGVLSIGEIKCETRCCVVVNQVGNVYRSVRSEMFVMLFHGRNFVVEVVMFQRRCCLRLDEASRPVLDSLVFARRHRHKSVESSHVVDTCWGQRLTECSRCSLRFTLGSVGGTGAWVGQRVPVVRLVAGVQRVRSVHDRRLVFFHLRSWWMCFHETIAVHNRRMILAHCSVSRGWNTFAATGIFGEVR